MAYLGGHGRSVRGESLGFLKHSKPKASRFTGLKRSRLGRGLARERRRWSEGLNYDAKWDRPR